MPFTLFAQPWWINALFFVPFLAYFYWRKNRLELSNRQLLYSALFGIAFGFIEAAVSVYLRATASLVLGYGGMFAEIGKLAATVEQQMEIVNAIPYDLWALELFREIATLIALFCIALITAKKLKERGAIFLWTFAFWDLFYYAGLYATIRWPHSLLAPDVLFLIPMPWIAQVWFPLLISILTILAVFFARIPPS